MIIFCPKDGGPGQLICPGGGVSVFVLGWRGLKKMPSAPRGFFIEQPSVLKCKLFKLCNWCWSLFYSMFFGHDQSINQSIKTILKWPTWHSHCKDHWYGEVGKLNQDMIAEIKKNILAVDEKLTVNLQRRRQLAVCSRCLEPQPHKLGCQLLTASLAVPRDGWCW